jgi:cytochrome c2
MKKQTMIAVAAIAIVVASPALAQKADVSRGQQDFRACSPCHSLESDRNMTGPSLANLWGRKAGSLPSFERYSDALKETGIIWRTAHSMPGSPIQKEWCRETRCRSKALPATDLCSLVSDA